MCLLEAGPADGHPYLHLPAGDPGAVGDARLRVHGLARLRVADASVMPSMPGANLCAATMMIGKKAADLLLER